MLAWYAFQAVDPGSNPGGCIMMIDVFSRKVRITEERMEHVLRRSEMKNQRKKIAETLRNPDTIVESKYDKTVLLYHKFYPKTPVTTKYLLVAVKILDKDAFVITAFFTDKIKKGDMVWEKK